MKEPLRFSWALWWNYASLLIAVGLAATWARGGIDPRLGVGIFVGWLVLTYCLWPHAIWEHLAFLDRWVFHEYGKARQRYRKAVNTGKATPEAYLALASLTFAEGEWAEAAELCRLAHRKRSDAYAGLLLTLALIRAGNVPFALQVAMDHISKHKDKPAANYALAEALKASGDLGAAERAYRDALAMAPGMHECMIGLADIMITRGRLEEASSLVDRVLRENPRSPDALYYYGRILLDRGDAPAARKAFGRALAYMLPSDKAHKVAYSETVRQLASLEPKMGS